MKVLLAEGGTTRELAATPGERLLDTAQRAGLPLEGTCGGDMACATCHVVVASADFARLPAASAEEEDMLDLVPDAVRTSRLACQVRVDAALGNLTFSLPAGSRNMQRG